MTEITNRARQKLAYLQDQFDTAQLVTANAVSRIKALNGSLMESPAEEGDYRKDELHELQSRRAAYQAHESIMGNQLGRIRGFMATLPPGAVLVDLDLPKAKPKRGETPAEAVERVRREIDALLTERRKVAAAPLPRKDKADLIRKHINEIRKAYRPQCLFPPGKDVVIRWGDAQLYGPPNAQAIFAIAAYLDPTRVEEMLIGDLDDEEKGAMPADVREKKLAEIDDRIERLGLEEEALIELAEGTVPRRPDCDPRIVLGVRVARRARPVAAAAAA